MKLLVNRTSIKSRLIQIQLLISLLLLSACAIAFITNDLFLFKRSVERNLESTARILGRNLAPAIAFADKQEAAKIIASLQAEPSITSVSVFDSTGELFSRVGESALKESPKLKMDETSSVLDGSKLKFYFKMGTDQDPEGLLVLEADLKVFATDYKNYVLIVAGVILAGLIISYAFANLIQRSLSGPIVELAATAKRISTSSNFSLRMTERTFGKKVDELEILSTEFNQMLDQIQAKDEKILAANAELEKKVEERTHELREIQKSALENAHAAGMAEIATGILHNIGNIANSVNTSTEEIAKIIQQSKITGLLKANQLLQENMGRLVEFFSTDQKGKILPEYYIKVGNSLKSEFDQMRDEVEGLNQKIALIKEVIHMQQDYAKKRIFVEELSLVQVVDEILNLQKTSLLRHEIEIVKDYHQDLKVKMQRVKFAHILMNLIKNAKEAMKDTPLNLRRITISIGETPNAEVYLQVSDTGEGVSQENLNQIFNHGFTTKNSGHGFGLHFCANAMTEMNGKMTVDSKGRGHGATFTLTFPKIESVKREERKLKHA